MRPFTPLLVLLLLSFTSAHAQVTLTVTFTAQAQSDLSVAEQAIVTDGVAFWDGIIEGRRDGVSSTWNLEVDTFSQAASGGSVALSSGGPTTLVLSNVVPGSGLGGSWPNQFILSSAGILSVNVHPDAGALQAAAIKHDVGHALGIGTLWEDNEIYNDGVAGNHNRTLVGGIPGQLVGPATLAAFKAEFDAGATFVPVELDGGSGIAHSHWNVAADLFFLENTLGPDGDPGDGSPAPTSGGLSLDDELMTGTLSGSAWVSDTTIASLYDLGYFVASDAPSLLFWDATPGTPDGASQGGAGTWDTATANWDWLTNGSYQVWNNANNDTAVFAGTAGTVTLDSNVTIGGLQFDSDGYNVAPGTGPYSVTFGIDGDIYTTTGTTTISAALAGSSAISKSGPGVLRLTNNATNYSGATTINAGVMDFGGIPLANLGGGSGQNISVAAEASVGFNAVSDTTLGRLVNTTDEIGVFTGSTSNNLDFSSSPTPNAFLGNWKGNNGKTQFSGTITPAGGNYRLGYPDARGLLGVTSLLTGENGLIVGGNRVILVNPANDFTGDTVIRDGARLNLGNNLALQNSALNTDTGLFTLSEGTATGPITGDTASPSPTFGGLKGSGDLLSMYSTAPNNNESALATINVIGFTLNPGTGKSYTYLGAIDEFASGTTLSKTGAGTQVLSGTNTYTGSTTVSGGLLEIGGGGTLGSGNYAADISVDAADSGTLKFNSTANQTLGGIISGTGALVKDNTGDLILTAINSFTGNTTISGGTLQIGGNNTPATLGPVSYAGDITIASGALLLFTNNTSQTLSGVISGDGSLQKAGSGTLTLSGANTYTGKTTIAANAAGGPTLSVSSLNSVNGGTPLLSSSSLGAPTTVPDGTIQLGSRTNIRNCSLIYTGPGETTDRIINVEFNTGSDHAITASGTGLLKFTSPFDYESSNGNDGSGLTLKGTGDGEISAGMINTYGDGAYPGYLTKSDAGTWTLGGTNSVNSAIIDDGSLIVSGSLEPATTLTASNGTLTVDGSLAVAATTISGATLDGAGSLAFTIDGTSSDLVTMTGGTLTATGLTIAINPTGSGLTEAEYVLVDATGGGTISGEFAALTGATDYALNYDTPNQVKLLITAPAPVASSADAGPGSLRAALNQAALHPGPDTITFDPALDGQTITLGGTQLLIDNDLTIDASSLTNGLTISGNSDGDGVVEAGESRIFEINSGMTVTLAYLTLSNGEAFDGGAIQNYGTLTINNSTLSGNSAGSEGGAILNDGTLTINNSTLSANTAEFSGAILNNDTLTINNSTLSGNSADFEGGAIQNFPDGTLTINNSTLSGNSAGNEGGAILNYGTLTINNSIVAGNTRGGLAQDISQFGSYGSNSGVNFIGDTTDASPIPGVLGTDYLTGDPQLATLADYGGPTHTMPPLPGSPAIDAATAGGPASDQRGFARPNGPLPDIGAVEAQLSLLVANNDDSGPGSLRQTIADADSGATITFDGALDGSTITLGGTQLLLNKNLTIDASSLTNGLTISGNSDGDGVVEAGESRIFRINSGMTVTLAYLTLSNGEAFDGGAIQNYGTLTINNSTLSGNSAGNDGGAIQNYGTLTINNSTLSGNSADFRGGAILNYDTLTINNSTLSGNSADIEGGAILNWNILNLNNSTLSANSAGLYGGAIQNIDTLTINNSIVAGNTRGGLAQDIQQFGSYGSNSGVNFIGDLADSGLTSGATVLTGDPQLAPLGDYGGPTQTMPPLPGSPAIDAATAGGPATDQRGFTRPNGAAPDIGAVEAQLSLLVANNGDSGPGSLRQTIVDADPGATITFDPSLDAETIALFSQLILDKDLTIDASALAGGLILDGGGNTRLFEVASGTSLTLGSLTITGGNGVGTPSSGSGGAIYSEGILTIDRCTISNSTATYGGGIFQRFGLLTLTNSLVVENEADDCGGVYVWGAGGPHLFINSTLTENHATSGDGGACKNYNSSLRITHSTIANNSATGSGGGLRLYAGDSTVSQSLVVANSAGMSDNISVAGTFTNDNTLEAPTAILAPLGDYGGPTQTMPPLTGSPTIEAGVLTFTTPLTDQSGRPRPSGGGQPDLGAMEALAYSPYTTTVITEGFESPDVVATAGDGSTDGTLPDNGLWVGSAQGYQAGWRGITDTAGGDFSDTADGTSLQAFAFRYTNSGLTTAEGVIGSLQEGATYTVSFDVVQDLGGSNGLPYIAQLLAYSESDDRSNCVQGSIPAGATLLSEVTGSATDGVTSFQTVTFQFTPDSGTHAAEFGKDVVFRFMGATTSAIVDNVVIAATTVTPSFFEGFEDPDVVGYDQGTTPDRWVRHSGTYNSHLHGIIDGSTGDFTAEATGRTGNTQAYAFRYTSSPGITSKEGEIGPLVAGATYSLSFDAQQDLGDLKTGGGMGDWYDVSLMAFDAGAVRDSGPDSSGQNILVSQIGQIALDANWHRITLTFTVPYNSPHLGKDVGILFSDVWEAPIPPGTGGSRTSAIIDNVELTVAAETVAPTLLTIVDSVAGAPVDVPNPVTYTVTFDDIMNASTLGTDDFENGGSAGITIDSLSATGDPAVYEVVISTVSPGELTLQVKAGAELEDASGNALDTGSAITDDTTIDVLLVFAGWISGYDVGGLIGFDDDGDGDGNANGVENFFGTDPSVFSEGITITGQSGNTFTFTHPLNDSPATDITAGYRWSSDLETFYDDGDSDGAGTTTVDFAQGAPVDGIVTVTATISGSVIPGQLFVVVEVTQN